MNLTADLDFDLTIFVVAVDPPLLLGAGVATMPSHDDSPLCEKCMGRGLAGAESSSEAP